MTLNILEKVTLDAFIEALRQSNSPLPTAFQQQINQVGNAFEENPTAAINQLLNLAENECIKQLYNQARIAIQKNYETQERPRFYSPENQNLQGAKPDDDNTNIAIKVSPTDVTSDTSNKIKVLQADDSPAAAQNLPPEPPNYELTIVQTTY